MTSNRDPVYVRSDIIGKAQAGELSAVEAEAEAARLGVGPLASKPDADKFDPMAEPFWTMVMAIAWIAWRTPAAVRDSWDHYRAECFDWHFRRNRVGFDGPVQDGWFLEQRRPASQLRLQLSDAWRRASGDEAALPLMSVAASEEALAVALQNGCFPAFGLKNGGEERSQIPADSWLDLKCMNDRNHDYFAPSSSRLTASVRYDDVRVHSGSVTRLWPSPRPKPALALPVALQPDGPGFMTVFHAALWIATKGGNLPFEPASTLHWQLAFAELIDAMATGEVRVTGVRNGVRESIDGAVFAGCRVDYPYGEAPDNVVMADEFCIRSYPYIDDEHWRGGLDDSFENRRETRWKQLMVAKPDVSRLWPYAMAVGTGAPGRPSSMFLVRAEFEARVARGEICDSLGEQARQLSEWLRLHHPNNPPAKAGSIANGIRKQYNAAPRA